MATHQRLQVRQTRMHTHSSRGPRCWKTRSQAARGRGWSDPAAKGRVSGSGLRGGGRTTCRSNCGGLGGGAGPRGQLSSGPPLPGRMARRPPRFSFSPELPRAGRRPFRASPGASSSLSDVPDESESVSESEEEEEVSGTRSSSWHIRLKRSSFSLCGDGDGTAGPSAEAIGGFGFCKETGEAVLGPRVHFPNHSPKRSHQRMKSPRRQSTPALQFPYLPCEGTTQSPESLGQSIAHDPPRSLVCSAGLPFQLWAMEGPA